MINQLLPVLVVLLTVAVGMALIMKRLGQPLLVGYILAGVAIGEGGLGIIPNRAAIESVGSLGVLFLLFFIGIETPVEHIRSSIKKSGIGLLLQVVCSVLAVLTLGVSMGWPFPRILLIGFVLTMSSSVVILGFIRKNREPSSEGMHQQVLMISILQDLAVVPMMIVLSNLSEGGIEFLSLAKQIIGAILGLFILRWIFSQKTILQLPTRWLKDDKELTLLILLLVCLSFSLLSSLAGLSTALGAFLAGMFVRKIKHSDIHELISNLEPFRVVFLALFFISIGMLIDTTFFLHHFGLIVALVLFAFVINTAINTVVLKALDNNWRDAIRGSSYLAQIGEFSFVLALVGYNSGIITDFGYQTTIAIIATSLALSPAWIFTISKISSWGR